MSARASSKTLLPDGCSLLLLAAGLVLAGAAPAMAQTEAGLALRQNSLTLDWPSRPAGVPLPAGSVGMSETRLRAWLGQSWEEVTITGAVEVQTGLSSAGSGGVGLIGGSISPSKSRPFEIVDLTWEQAPSTASSTRARVERLEVAWRWGMVDVDLGRQPVSLGTSHFVGVLDVLAPFAPGAMDASYKPGIDALRMRTALGDTGEAELIVAGRDPWRLGGTLGRMRGSVSGMDLEILGGRFRNRAFGGLGWEGELGPLGIWGELALFERRPAVEGYRGGWDGAAFSGVMGADFNLPFEAHGGLAVMHQDFGARRPEDLGSVYTDAPYQEGWAFLGAADYGVVTVSRQLHPLAQGSLAGIVNLVDGSMLWQPRVTLSVSDNSDLGAYAWIGLGAPPRVEGGTLVLGSEFGMVPTGLGLYARWFF